MELLSFSALTASQLTEIVAIYREAFEAPWEWPTDRIAGLAQEEAAPARGCALALVDGDAAIGLAIADYLPAANLSCLHYLAVAPARRCAGAGAILLDAAAQRAKRGPKRQVGPAAAGRWLRLSWWMGRRSPRTARCAGAA